MLELIFQGFMEWAYGLVLECWEYFSSALLDIMSLDFAYLETHVPIINDLMQVLLAAGWALLIGNLVFQAVKSMLSGLGFEGEDPKLLFTRTFIFAFLLLASPQICRTGLDITSRIMSALEIPDAVNVTLVDESIFGSLTAAWLLVIICGLIIMFKVFRLILEIAERYVILAMLTITAPLAFAMGGSRNTSEIFTGWCRMFGSMCVLMALNVVFFKMLLSVLSTIPSGLDVLPWMVLIMTIVKVAKKSDAIVTRIGLNPAITGDNLGVRFPGALTYMVIRGMTSQVTKAVGKSAGSSGRGASPNTPPGGSGVGREAAGLRAAGTALASAPQAIPIRAASRPPLRRTASSRALPSRIPRSKAVRRRRPHSRPRQESRAPVSAVYPARSIRVEMQPGRAGRAQFPLVRAALPVMLRPVRLPWQVLRWLDGPTELRGQCPDGRIWLRVGRLGQYSLVPRLRPRHGRNTAPTHGTPLGNQLADSPARQELRPAPHPALRIRWRRRHMEGILPAVCRPLNKTMSLWDNRHVPVHHLPPRRRRPALTPPAGLLSSMGRLFQGKPALPTGKRLRNILDKRSHLLPPSRSPHLPQPLSPARQEWGPAVFLSGPSIRHSLAGTVPWTFHLRKDRRLPARHGRNRARLLRQPRPRSAAGLPGRTPARQEYRLPAVRQGSQPAHRPGGRRLPPPQQTLWAANGRCLPPPPLKRDAWRQRGVQVVP